MSKVEFYDASGNALTTDQLSKHLAQADIVFFGELHSKEQVLAAQMNVMRAMAELGSLTLVLEMFNCEQQSLLDSYAADKIDKEEFTRIYREEGKEGFPLEHYGQLVDLAKDLGVRIRAGFLPRPIANRVLKEGTGALRGYDKLPEEELLKGNEGNLEFFASQLPPMGPMGKLPFPVESFFLAQSAKDTFMAREISAEVVKHSSKEQRHRILAIAGRVHFDYGYGVPDRVITLLSRELKEQSMPRFLLLTTLEKDESLGQIENREQADLYVRLT